MKIFLIAFLVCLLAFPASAAERRKTVTTPVRHLDEACIVEASRMSGIPLAALCGILVTEGGRTGEALDNTNGTWDVGAFQVNTVHVDELLEIGIPPEAVLKDGCVNAHAAAWLLKKEYRRTGNLWDAIGAYHSRTPKRHSVYIRRVRDNLKKLSQQGLAMLEPFYKEEKP